jgi:hypothetical protein
MSDHWASQPHSVRVSGVAGAPPVAKPLIDTVSDGRAGSVLAIVSLPVWLPVAVDPKRILAVWEEPAPMLNGVPKDTAAKRAFELVTELTVRVAFPVLRKVSTRSSLWPVAALPNSGLVGHARRHEQLFHLLRQLPGE